MARMPCFAPSLTSRCAAAYDSSNRDINSSAKARAEFADSRFPDLRTAGTAYVDLAVALLTARGTDGYQTVWFYQRLSLACAKHGWKQVSFLRAG